MADEIQATQPTPVEVTTADLKRYPGLVPGAAEALASVWGSSLGTMPADVRAAEIEKRMGSGLAARYKDPEYQGPAKLANGVDPSPLRQVVSRYADKLQPEAVDKVVSQLGPQLNGKPTPEIAKAVVRFLGSREAEPHLNTVRELPTSERTVIDRLEQHFGGELDYQGRQALARDRSDLARMDERSFVMTVARSLNSSAVRDKYGAGSIAPDDPRLTGRPTSITTRPTPTPTPAPVRGADGRFQQPPTDPKRRSLVF